MKRYNELNESFLENWEIDYTSFYTAIVKATEKFEESGLELETMKEFIGTNMSTRRGGRAVTKLTIKKLFEESTEESFTSELIATNAIRKIAKPEVVDVYIDKNTPSDLIVLSIFCK